MEDKKKEIFVFGSNEAGIHGAGAAYHAHRHYHAEWGVGVGRTGDTYAIPTKDYKIKTLPLHVINEYVLEFLEYAEQHPELTFNITKIGCGLAGYVSTDIAPMFEDAPANCKLDSEWMEIIKTLK